MSQKGTAVHTCSCVNAGALTTRQSCRQLCGIKVHSFAAVLGRLDDRRVVLRRPVPLPPALLSGTGPVPLPLLVSAASAALLLILLRRLAAVLLLLLLLLSPPPAAAAFETERPLVVFLPAAPAC